MRTAPKWIVLLCAMVLAALPVCRASADSLELTGAGPAGTVYLTGSALPSPYNTTWVNAYAGVLDWTDKTDSTTVYTYCIDVAAIIQAGNTYNFNSPVALQSAGLGFSSQQLNGLYNLWNDNTDFGNATGVNGPVTSASQQDAAMFQVAIWDILYNAGSESLTNTNLSFSSPGDGLDSAHLQDALDYAHAAYTAPATTNPGIVALVATDGSQNQAIYIGGSGNYMSSVPLPGSLPAGLTLLALIGAAGTWRLRNNPIKATA